MENVNFEFEFEYIGRTSLNKWECNKWFVTLGYQKREITVDFHTGLAIAEPSIDDVLSSLLMDARAQEYNNFEEWVREYGYDQDSRKDEKIYRECLEIAEKVHYLLGDDLEQFEEKYQDY